MYSYRVKLKAYIICNFYVWSLQCESTFSLSYLISSVPCEKVWSLLSFLRKRPFLVLTPALTSSWRHPSSAFPTGASHRPLWVAVPNSRRSKTGAAAAAAAATLTLLWLKNLHKLLKVATGVLLGNISERHFDASNDSLLPLRCLFFLFLVRYCWSINEVSWCFAVCIREEASHNTSELKCGHRVLTGWCLKLEC